MIEIDITGDKEVLRLLRDLSARMKDMTPAMRNIAGIMHDAVEENFAEQGRPEWRLLAASTIKQRARHGHWPGKIFQVSGMMASSVNPRSDANSAAVGTNRIYARIQQLGGEAGRGHKSIIPARPFLKLTQDDVDAMKEELRRYILNSYSK